MTRKETGGARGRRPYVAGTGQGNTEIGSHPREDVVPEAVELGYDCELLVVEAEILLLDERPGELHPGEPGELENSQETRGVLLETGPPVFHVDPCVVGKAVREGDAAGDEADIAGRDP